MYRDDEANQFLEVTYQNGDKEVMYFKDFSSGRHDREHRAPGQEAGHQAPASPAAPRASAPTTSSTSIHQEYKEHEDLPNTTNPDDWAKISGKKGERIVYIRTLVKADDEAEPEGGRSIERVATGQYL